MAPTDDHDEQDHQDMMAKSTAVISPNLGLYLDRPPISMDPRMIQAGQNFRVKQYRLSNLNLGWTTFDGLSLNGPCTLIDNFLTRDNTTHLIFGSPTDLYKYNPGSPGTLSYITPRYETGTASASGTAVTGTGTLWNTNPSASPGPGRLNAKAGDQITFGATGVVSQGATWFTIQSVNSDTSLTLTASAGTVANGAYTLRQRFGGVASTVWSSDSFINASPANEDQWYATNGVDQIVRWNGTADQVSFMTTFGFTCKTLRNYSNMMLYGNIVQGGTSKPTDMLNSDVGKPSNVGAATTGLSNQFKVHGGTDGILKFERLADYIVIYCARTVVLAQFTGDVLVFTFRQSVVGKGPIGPRAVARFPDYHEFIGEDAQYRYDGSTAKRVNNHVWRVLTQQIDPARQNNVYSYFDENNGDLIWSTPLTTDPGVGNINSAPVTAFVEHYLEVPPQTSGSFTQAIPHGSRDFPFTATGSYFRSGSVTWSSLTNAWNTYNFRWNDNFFAAQFPFNMAGDANGVLYTFNSSQDANGVAMNSFVRFGRRAVIDGKNRGIITRVFPFTTRLAAGLAVTARLMDFANGPATILAPFTYDQSLPEGQFFVSVWRAGRYVEFDFGTNALGAAWELEGYDMLAKPGGGR